MRQIFSTTVIALAAATLVTPTASSAQEAAKPFELAIFSPLQVRNQDDAISIFRFSLLYGSNVSVRGLDIGLVAHNSGGMSKGLQGSLVGLVDGDFLGWQAGLVSITRGEFTGLQSGGYNQIDQGEAFQFGWVNRARDVSGLQIGFVNHAENMYGVQIGLINIIKSKQSLVFLPIVNWSF